MIQAPAAIRRHRSFVQLFVSSGRNAQTWALDNRGEAWEFCSEMGPDGYWQPRTWHHRPITTDVTQIPAEVSHD